MKCSGFRMLLLVALLFSLPVIAYSEYLYNGSFDLAFTENKTDIQEEVTRQVSGENMAELFSVEFIQSEIAVYNNYSFVAGLISAMDIVIYNKRKRRYVIHIRSPDIIAKAA